MSELGGPNPLGLTPKNPMFDTHYAEDVFQPGRAEILYPYVKSVVKGLRWVDRTRYFADHSRGFTLYDLINEGIYNVMPRTRKSPNKPTQRSDGYTPTPETRSVQWANVRLSNDDIAYLTDHQTSPEVVGAMLLAVADRGYNFSVKAMDDGKSIMCAIIGFVDDNPRGQMGCSAFAATPFDAAFACLYKFDQLLGGSFKSGHVVADDNRPRFR